MCCCSKVRNPFRYCEFAVRLRRMAVRHLDLLDHTPVDVPSRPLIAQALDEALRIAEKCDRAQGNATFLRRAE